MASDLDLNVMLSVKGNATKELKKFNAELKKSQVEIKKLSSLSLKAPKLPTAPTMPTAAAGGVTGSVLGGAALGGGVAGLAAISSGFKISNALATELTEIFVQMGSEISTVVFAFEEINSEIMNGSTISKAWADSAKDINKWANENRRDLGDLQEKIEKGTKDTDKNTRATDKNTTAKKKSGVTTNALSGIWKKFGTVIGVVSVGLVTKSILETGARFESLHASLTTVTGSATEANLAFALIKDTASKLPTTIEETTTAFIRMQSLGITPTQERMISFGNTASAMGKSVLQFTEAVADAATGEFERLKEFGIKAASSGDLVKFTFQGATTSVGKNAVEITNYLEAIGRESEDISKRGIFAGAAAKQMDTLTGKTSNLNDSWLELQNTISEGFLADFAKNVIDILTSMTKSMNEQFIWVRRIGVGLVGMIGGGWITIKHSFLGTYDIMVASMQTLFDKIQNGFDDFVFLAKSSLNDLASFVPGMDIPFEDLTEPVVRSANNITDAMVKRTKAFEDELAVHEKAIGLWAMDVELTNNAATGIKQYNEELNKRAKLEAEKNQKLLDGVAAQKKMNELLKEGKQLTSDMRTPIETYRDRVEELGVLLKAKAIDIETFNRAVIAAKETASGGIVADTRTADEVLGAHIQNLNELLDEGILSWDEYSRAVFAAQDEYDELAEKGEDTFTKLQEMTAEFAQGSEQNFSNFFFDIMQGNMTSLADSFKGMIDRMVADYLASELASGLFGSFTQTTGSFGGILGGLLTRAEGGFVPAGTPTLVGDGGRTEVIQPMVDSFVHPSIGAFNSANASANQGSSTTNHYTINATDSKSFMDMIERDDRAIVEVINKRTRSSNMGRI